MRQVPRENRLEGGLFALPALHERQHEVLHFPQFSGQNRGIPAHLLEAGLFRGEELCVGEAEFRSGVAERGSVGVHLVGEQDEAELAQHRRRFGGGLVESGWQERRGGTRGRR